MIFNNTYSSYTRQQYFGFFRKAKTIHQIDSPFVYRFAKYVVEDRRNFYIFPLGRLLYREAKQQLARPDFHRFSLAPPSGKRLFRAIHLYKPELALTLGTGDGLASIYMATAMLSGDLLGTEADPFWYAFAKKQIDALGLPNVTLINDNASAVLPEFLAELEHLDFLFLHGSMPGNQLPDFFEQVSHKLHAQSVVVIHSPYQSKVSTDAWQSLSNDPKVMLSIDVFDLGFLFFDPAFREKQYVRLVPVAWKFWKIGLFR